MIKLLLVVALAATPPIQYHATLNFSDGSVELCTAEVVFSAQNGITLNNVSNCVPDQIFANGFESKGALQGEDRGR